MSSQLCEVEHVSDETLEPHRLGGDDVERRLDQLGIVHEPVAERVNVPANAGQRCPQLVRDGHQETAFALLRLGKFGRHLVEPLGEVADLTASCRRHNDVVAAGRDLVSGVGESQNRCCEATREVPREDAGNRRAAEERDRQPFEQRQPLALKLGPRLRDDQRAERGCTLLQAQRLGGREELPVLARRDELECQRPVAREDAGVDGRGSKLLQARALPREHGCSDVVDPVAGCQLKLRRSECRRLLTRVGGAEGRFRVELSEARRLPTELRERLRAGVGLEEPGRNQCRDDPRQDDPDQEDCRQPEAQRPCPR